MFQNRSTSRKLSVLFWVGLVGAVREPCRKSFSPFVFLRGITLPLLLARWSWSSAPWVESILFRGFEQIFRNLTDICFLAMCEIWRVYIDIYSIYICICTICQIYTYKCFFFFFSKMQFHPWNIFFYITYCLNCTGVKMTWLNSAVMVSHFESLMYCRFLGRFYMCEMFFWGMFVLGFDWNSSLGSD